MRMTNENTMRGIVEWSAERDQIFPALRKAQAKAKNATKTATSHQYKYETLSSLLTANKEVLDENQLFVLPVNNLILPGKSQQYSMIGHDSGQYVVILSEYETPKRGLTPQIVGGLISYDRRYRLKSTLNVVGINEDDDARHIQKLDDRMDEEFKREQKAARKLEGAQRFMGRLFGTMELLAGSSAEEATTALSSWFAERVNGDTHEQWARKSIKLLGANEMLSDRDTSAEYPLAMSVRHKLLGNVGVKDVDAWIALIEVATRNES